MLLCSGGPGGAKSENSKRYFGLKQVAVIRELEKGTTSTATDSATTLNVRANAAATIWDRNKLFRLVP